MNAGRKGGATSRREALFLADGGPRVGSGHVARSRALAEAFLAEGWRITFARPGCGETLDQGPEGAGLVFAELGDVLATMGTRAASGRTPFELAVVDHYGLDWEKEAVLRCLARRIVVVDDLADRRHDCDLLVDATPGRRAEDYADLVPASAPVLTGPEHALLRPSFAALRERSLSRARTTPREVFVSFGGSTAQSLSAGLAAAAAAAMPDARVVVAMTPDAPGLDEARTLSGRSGGRIAVLEGGGEVAEAMAGADLAIGGGGTMAWERCCLGLPSLVVVLAENQVGNVRALAARGAAVEIETRATGPELRNLLQGVDLPAMSRRAASMCDGLGVRRVWEAVIESLGGGGLTARRAAAGDSSFVWETNNDPFVRSMSLSTGSIPWEEHERWYAERLGDENSIVLVLEAGGERTGVVRLRRRGDAAVVSVALSPRSRGMGFGTDAIRFGSRIARSSWPVARVEAVIRETNGASLKAFGKAGFVEERREPGGLALFVERWPPAGPGGGPRGGRSLEVST